MGRQSRPQQSSALPQPQSQPQPQPQSQSQSSRFEAQPCALVLGSIAGIRSACGDEGPSDRRSRVRSYKVQSVAIDVANTHFSPALYEPLASSNDGTFDGLVQTLAGALEISRFMRLQTRSLGVDVRVVVAAVMSFDRCDEPWARLLGEGFVEARRKLVASRGAARYGFSVPGRRQLEMLLDAVGRTLDDIESGWTEAQFDYVLEVLVDRPRTRAEVAAALGVSQNSLFKALRGARYGRYVEQFAAARAALEIEDHRRRPDRPPGRAERFTA